MLISSRLYFTFVLWRPEVLGVGTVTAGRGRYVCVWVHVVAVCSVQNGSADRCGSVVSPIVAGSSAREMDGSGGSVRPGLHAPERCVSLHKPTIACQPSTHVEPPYSGGIRVLKYRD